MMTVKRLGVAALVASLAVGWGPSVVMGQDAKGAPEDHAGHDHDEHEGEDVIPMTPRDMEDFGIVLTTAGSDLILQTLTFPGEIHPDDDKLAHLVARYDGMVTEVRARVGQKVAKGEVLAIIESDESLAPYELKTLIAGTVIEKHITLGEAVSRDRAPFVVADLGSVWLDLFVNQRDLHRVAVGQDVKVAHRPTGTMVTETISYIAPVLDEHTRTATARVVLGNADGRWRPGMFVNCEVELSRRQAAVVVPAGAVFTVHEHPVVFLVEGEGFFPSPVVLGEGDGDRVEILSGLSAGATYVVEGGFTLKAQLEKSSFDDGHNH